MSRARMRDLDVLDLTDPQVLRLLDLDVEQLTGDDRAVCQALAAAARAQGLDGVLAPSAAPPGERTLAVFGSAIGKVEAEHVQRPPVRMLDVLDRIRLPGPVAELVGRLYEALRRLARRLAR